MISDSSWDDANVSSSVPALLATLCAAIGMFALSRSNPGRRLSLGPGGRGEQRGFWVGALAALGGGFTGLSVARLMDTGHSKLSSLALSLIGPLIAISIGIGLHNWTHGRPRP